MTTPTRNCHTCARLVQSEVGAFLCTSSGPDLTRWRVKHKPQGEMPPADAPECPGWKAKE